MNYNNIAGTDLSVSELCFGCWGIVSDFHWGDRDADASVATMNSALDAGINFFDTATVYGNGASEELVGQFFKDNGKRSEVVIASKVPPNRMKPDEIVAECEASLQRLQTDYLDLYQTHWTSPDVPVAESWGAFLELKQQGKVRNIGVCNMGTSDLDAACGLQKPVTNQLPYNLLWRMLEPEILPRCNQDDIGILVYSPLMHGILADKYKTAADVPDGRARSRHFNGERELSRHGEPGCEDLTFETLDRIRAICTDLDRHMADVSLAWLLKQPGIVSVIAGASTPAQLQANINSVANPLSDEVIQQLNDATAELLQALGTNPDMWDGGENSRYH